MVLKVTGDAVMQIMNHASADHPIECCGIMSACIGGDVVSRVTQMKNDAASRVFFSFNPGQQLKVLRELESRNEFLAAIYHSHTESEAYPSREDILHAGYPDAHYVIVSTWGDAKDPHFRSFRVIDGCVMEESVVVLDNNS